MDLKKEFHGPNAGYVLDLYERYLADPQSVDAQTRSVFSGWQPPPDGAAPAGSMVPASQVQAAKIAGAVNLANALRAFGRLAAQLDPLGGEPPGDPWLDPAFYDLTPADLRQIPAAVIGGPASEAAANAEEAIQRLRAIYCGAIGYDYGHIHAAAERDWLREAAECGRYRPPDDPIDEQALLQRLAQIEGFELFLHRIFPGKTRFSIEGVDMLVPMLDELFGCAAEAEICSIMVGMAHRGRLNVLAHSLGKTYAHLLAEFSDPQGHFWNRNEIGWTGDVKYHKGARRAVRGAGAAGEDIKLFVSLAPNPSHLEHIDPVVLGMARAAGSKTDQPGPPEFFPDAALPVIIHGDASFMGQGIVAETLNLSQLPGYTTGGAVHIITNNQLGYTTNPQHSRSAYHASDLAKGFEIPVMHVNADDPIACIEAIRTAFDYRQQFGKDFLVDLIGYRRYGHNEGDEPAFTQPLMYATIDRQPTVRQKWAQRLAQNGQIDADQGDALVQQQMEHMQAALAELEAEQAGADFLGPRLQPPARGAAKRVPTAVNLERLRQLNEALLTIPADFTLHRKLERAHKRRRQALDDPEAATIDWATAEELAFGSILEDGTAIRLTGEDVERGTFSQRHAVFHDPNRGATFTPLAALPQATASFEVHNSPLSENAVLGYEFGYNVTAGHLVVWEAQYGDFINGAQVIIDEFLVSARAKWEQTPSLVLLLPHGHEGQGPDHSSGRPERFLQLAAEYNLRLANCTTAAQYFHLLRRQAALLKSDPLPLVILTPKSLLRHPLVASAPQALASGGWQPVLDDPRTPRAARRLVLCSGKIYVDLVTSDAYTQAADQPGDLPAIVRLEQVYPFPADDLRQVIAAYPEAREFFWVQEEPQNMGAWNFVQARITALLPENAELRCIARPPNGSPAEGSAAWHQANQQEIINQALGGS